MSPLLDDQIRSAFDRVRSSVAGQLDSELTATAQDILRAAVAAQNLAVTEACERALTDSRRDADDRLTQVRTELARERDQAQQSKAEEIAARDHALAEIRDELATVRLALDDEQRGRQLIERELEQSRTDAELSRQVAQQARDSLTSLTRELEEARQSVAQRSLAMDDSNREMTELRRQIDSLRQEAEHAHAEANGATRELQRLRVRLAQAERLVSALQNLNEAGTLGDILDGLARSASADSARSAVFLVKEGKLRGWRAVGFESSRAIEGADFDPEMTGVIARAAQARAGQLHRNGDDRLLPVFARADGPRTAVAVPVEVGGSVIAVLYVDSNRTDTPEDAEWLHKVGTIAKQAGWALEAMTIRRAATLWLSGAVGITERSAGRPVQPSVVLS